jgi:hypothetical protein
MIQIPLSEELAMFITDTNDSPRRPLAEAVTEAEALREEVIDSSLHTDRAHHDELGRTEEPTEPDNHPDEAPPSPREQPAAPLDIQKIDE